MGRDNDEAVRLSSYTLIFHAKHLSETLIQWPLIVVYESIIFQSNFPYQKLNNNNI